MSGEVEGLDKDLLIREFEANRLFRSEMRSRMQQIETRLEVDDAVRRAEAKAHSRKWGAIGGLLASAVPVILTLLKVFS